MAVPNDYHTWSLHHGPIPGGFFTMKYNKGKHKLRLKSSSLFEERKKARDPLTWIADERVS